VYFPERDEFEVIADIYSEGGVLQVTDEAFITLNNIRGVVGCGEYHIE
jgi:hypothetical protein